MKDVGKIFGGLILIGLAAIWYRLCFIAPYWEGELSLEKIISVFYLLSAAICFLCGVGLIYETGKVVLTRRRLAQNRKRVFNLWKSL